MTKTDEPQYRQHYQPRPSDISVREADDDEDGLFVVRMPIASTGEVRNEGDEPLTRDEIDGMARQVNQQDVGVFLAHGRSFEITDARFGQTERLGTWQDADVQNGRADEDTDLLFADARLADPDSLPEETGRFREALAILKAQAERGIPLSASIGWREDDASPGGNDLMEASIVGIPADPRTVTQGAGESGLMAMARSIASNPNFDIGEVRDRLRTLHEFQTAVMGPDDDTDHEQMTDEEPESDAENEASDPDEEESERQDAPEWAERLLELNEEQSETLQAVADAVRQDDDDEEEDEDDGDDENETDEDEDEEEDDDDESAADAPDDEQDATGEIEALRDALDTLRDGGYDVDDIDLPEADDEERDADEPSADTDRDEDAAKALLR